jgi:Rrf2 family protein
VLKLSKKADYALMAVQHLALGGKRHTRSAHQLAKAHGISTTLMAKVLQRLARHGLIVAQHGAAGGYRLAKDPSRISALDVISAIDGPVQIMSCVTTRGVCDAAPCCSVREPLRRVNEEILRLLSRLTLAELSEEVLEPALVELKSDRVAVVGKQETWP